MLTGEGVYQKLLAAYGKPRWWSDDPFVVMFQAVLVQNTAWSSVERTCAPLMDSLAPEYIARLTDGRLEELIAPCGFKKAKSRTIRALAEWFMGYDCDREHFSDIGTDTLRRELMAIRGVGEETADVILVYAIYRPRFIVDAYTRRLLERLGYGFASDDAIRRFFEESLPRDAEIYGRLHWLILEHCIAACRKKPNCESCPFAEMCGFKAV